MGPGIVAAMAGNDAGGISTYSTAGAQFGYATLWMIPIMTVLLIIVQETCARMGAVTGKGLSSLIRENFGVRLAAFAMLALLVANTSTTLSEFAGVAAGMELFGVSKYFSVPVAAIAVWLLVMRGSYQGVQKVFLAISLVFMAYVIAAFLAKPNWPDVATATFIPQFRSEAGFVSLVIATIGTTIAPWMLFFTQNNVVEKGVTYRDMFFQRIDIVTGAVVACLVAWFIIITTGTVLHPAGIRISSAADAANALAPIAGSYAQLLFAAGLVAASLLAACVLPLTTSYAVCEAFGWEHGLDHGWREAPVFKTMFTVIIVLSVVIVLLPHINLMRIMLIAQVVSGALLPILLIFMVKLVNDRHLMGRYTNGRLYNAITWVAVVLIIALTLMLFVLQMLGYG
ncbi:MAG: Nramp family divalent metal transporter [Coriobacteriales bacterium]|nr:Nramp family divalent metal transporter [Coriobacteriales bacterium]